MKSNETLQRDVQDALKWEPLLHAAEIGVTVADGVVTLSGIVDSYMKKTEAENATKNVLGVKAVVEKIEIRYGDADKKSDGEIAKAIVNAFSWNWAVPSDKVKIHVENGWVILEGNLHWNYQREASMAVVTQLLGVKGVTNKITIKSESLDNVEKVSVEDALARNWSIDNENINVAVSGNCVTLTGVVDSYYQKDQAGKIAWDAPGVEAVQNHLLIEIES